MLHECLYNRVCHVYEKKANDYLYDFFLSEVECLSHTCTFIQVHICNLKYSNNHISRAFSLRARATHWQWDKKFRCHQCEWLNDGDCVEKSILCWIFNGKIQNLSVVKAKCALIVLLKSACMMIVSLRINCNYYHY